MYQPSIHRKIELLASARLRNCRRYTCSVFRLPQKLATANDRQLLQARLGSFRGTVDQSFQSPLGLCPIGHQGLMHEEATGLVYNRARYLHPTLGRFMQRDPLGYVDGVNVYE